MPPANVIVFTDTMVTSSVGAHTMDCPPTSTPSYASFYSGDNKRHSSSSNTDDNDVDLNADICPRHFTDIHRTKLEDTFSRKQKPDDIQLQIIAMECNLLYKDVRVNMIFNIHKLLFRKLFSSVVRLKMESI